ncbi:phosphate/phosphite/phosphonate ABC transporter substrate-binding protein [Desulfococcaceae bacterium HSG8]|nr:phosphate/phosphite/phosphonate ABC transporter substrate-binding protein [Desulfococcaceae bacterium HSG8]
MRQNFFWSRLLAFLMLLAVCAGQVYAEDITFGCYTSDKPTTMYGKFNLIMDYLQKQLGSEGINADIKIKIYPSYMKAIDALVKGDCDFVRFGPASYILAKSRNKNIRLLGMEHKNGEKTFKGIFITAKDSPVTSIKELKNRTFAFGSENSTVGRYLSQAELTKAGIRAGDLKSYKYLGRHDKVALAVAAGNYDAGVVKENTYKKYAESKGLRKIGEFLNVTKPWVVRENFDDKLFSALKKALLKLEDKNVLKSLKQHGFLSATDDDYAFVREGMRLSIEFGELP